MSADFDVEFVHGLLEDEVAALVLEGLGDLFFGGGGVVAALGGAVSGALAGGGFVLEELVLGLDGAVELDAEDAALPERVVGDEEGALAEDAGVEEGVDGGGVALFVGVQVNQIKGIGGVAFA